MMFSDPQLWLFVLSVIFLSAFIQGIIGFGYAIVAMAVLPLVLNFREANLLVAFSIVLPVIWIFWGYRRHSSPKILLGAILGSLVGLPLGLLTFTLIDLDYLVRGTGLVILLIVIDGFFQRPPQTVDAPQKASSAWSTFAGFCSGFLAGSTSIAGPPIVIYAIRQPWTQDQYKGFIFGFFILISITRIVGLSLMGLASTPVLMTAAVTVPVVILGMTLGKMLGPRINPVLFKRCLLSLLAVSSLYMVIQGSSEELPDASQKNARITSKR
tara:strand:- start:1979 stop:2785 length:807 start_codon:yes stop_codon:yes gene_type:complete